MVLCMKGLEVNTGFRLTQVFRSAVGDPNNNVAVWLGPGHVQDFVRQIPNCMVIGSEDIDTTKDFVETYSSLLIRLYIGQDLIGNEVGAAAKNVIGIAAGVCRWTRAFSPQRHSHGPRCPRNSTTHSGDGR